jgi:hypothetical protein
MKRTFTVIFELDYHEIDSGVIRLDQAVIDQVTDEWRENFYPHMKTPEDIAAHIAGLMIVHNYRLSEMDGWADLPDSYAEILSYPLGLDDFKVTANEIKEEAAK